MQNQDSNIKYQKAKALEVSIKEGSAASVTTGLTASYITPFALLLTNAKAIHIGFLSSFSGLISPIAQFLGSRLMEKYHRKQIVLFSVFWQAFLWLPLAALAFLAWKNLFSSYLIYFLIIVYSLLSAFSGIGHPSWFSWMGDLIPSDKRGKYFGKRNTIIGSIELAMNLIAGAVLLSFKKTEFAILGFASLFILASAFRYLSFSYLNKQFIPHLRPMKSYHVPLKAIIKENKDFKTFAIYQFFFNFAIMIASPFYAVYMLQDLGFNYLTFTLVIMASSVYYLLFTPLIGKISDKYGNIPLFYISNIFLAVNPLLWLFINKPLLLILIPQLVSGIANAAFVIAFTNFTYSTLPEERRGTGVAYANLLVGLGIFLGSLIGGILLTYLPLNFLKISNFFFVLIIAASLRIGAALFFLPWLKEKIKAKHLPHLHISILHPFKSINAEMGWLKHVLKSK